MYRASISNAFWDCNQLEFLGGSISRNLWIADVWDPFQEIMMEFEWCFSMIFTMIVLIEAFMMALMMDNEGKLWLLVPTIQAMITVTPLTIVFFTSSDETRCLHPFSLGKISWFYRLLSSWDFLWIHQTAVWTLLP